MGLFQRNKFMVMSAWALTLSITSGALAPLTYAKGLYADASDFHNVNYIDGWYLKQKSSLEYVIHNQDESLSLKLSKKNHGRIWINGKLFIFDFKLSEAQNRNRLARFLTDNFVFLNKNENQIIQVFQKLSDLLIPSAYASNTLAIALGALGLTGIIVGIIYNKKAKDQDPAERTERQRRRLAKYDEQIAYQNSMGDHFTDKKNEVTGEVHTEE